MDTLVDCKQSLCETIVSDESLLSKNVFLLREMETIKLRLKINHLLNYLNFKIGSKETSELYKSITAINSNVKLIYLELLLKSQSYY